MESGRDEYLVHTELRELRAAKYNFSILKQKKTYGRVYLEGGAASLGHNTQKIKREDIGSALPDGVDKNITHSTTNSSLLHVSLTAKALHGLLGQIKRILGTPELQDGSQQTKQREITILDLWQVVVNSFGTAQQANAKERKLASGSVLNLHVGKGCKMQRLLL
jgi:hypothetical protein